MNQPKAVFRGMIILYFVIGLEILIMISPAAGFFYAAFNPFLLSLAQSSTTRWLTAFFLPHMVSPPDLLLKTVRVTGSVLFVVGAAVFFICAGQVYYNKFTRRGVALGGLYSRIRHPQYLGLMLTGLGLSILWPRFLVVALWTVMVALYYLLARASRAFSSAILLRSDSRSDMSQGISFRAFFGERILIPLTGGKCFGFDVMIA